MQVRELLKLLRAVPMDAEVMVNVRGAYTDIVQSGRLVDPEDDDDTDSPKEFVLFL